MKVLAFICVSFCLAVIAGASPAFAQTEDVKVIRRGILNGKAKSLPEPEYPEELRVSGIEGIVKIAITIDEEGTVISAEPVYEDVRIVSRDGEEIEETIAESPHPLLIAPAQKAAMEARFAPTLLSGNPVRVKGMLVYSFGADRVDPPPPTTYKKIPSQISGGVLNGKARSLPAPAYPAAAQAVRASGTVTVRVVVDETGEIVSATAVSGHPLLKPAAVAAARRAKFSPTLLNGSPIRVTGILVYNFILPTDKK